MPDLDIEAHAITTKLGSHELVRQLVSHLGPTLVAVLAGVKDRTLPHKWEKATGPEPRYESLYRLQAAHRAWILVSVADSDSVARAWFIGANPRLGEESPVTRLREGDVAAVLAAAKAFVAGADD